MADYIPFEIQTEIMKRLPVKSLLQFRLVSKPWKSMIDNSHFINNYHVNNAQLRHHLLVRYIDPEDHKRTCVSIVDDDTFPEHQFMVTDTVPFELVNIVGTSQGLFCFYRWDIQNLNGDYGTAAIWNPSIRKSVVISVPNVFDRLYSSVIGFGVCPHTSDPVIVKILYIPSNLDFVNITSIPWQVEVFTLSSGVWRSPSKNLPRLSISFIEPSICKDGFIYWLSVDRVIVGNGYQSNYLIMSFNMISEEFTEVYLPHSLAYTFDLNIYMLRESLVVLEENYVIDEGVYGVWMMEDGEDGVTKSFKKVFTIRSPEGSIGRIFGFRKNGEAIIEMTKFFEEKTFLFYEPHSQQSNIVNFPKGHHKSVISYMETLLLLDH